MSKPETTKPFKSPKLVKCQRCGNIHGPRAKHVCRTEILVDQVTTDWSTRNVIGLDHESTGRRLREESQMT